MRNAGLLVLALALVTVAGCIGSDEPDEISPADAETPDQETVDAMDALEKGEPSANLALLAHWDDGQGQEADPAEEHLYLSRGDGTVSILDVTDPEAPQIKGEIQDVPASLDVKVSDDRRYAFVAEDQEASDHPLGGTGPFTGGIYVFDVSDPTAPERVTFEPVGNSRGPHMVTYFDVPGQGEHVFAAAGNEVVIHAFDRDAGTLEEVARYEPGQLEQNRDTHVVDAYYNARGWLHDMFVMEEPDGSTFMYVAAWDAGLHIVDVTDPTNPERLGSWNDFADDETGNLHTVTTEWIGDKRITVGTPEVGFAVVGGTPYAQGEEKNVVYVWDTTDPEAPELVSRWVNPLEETTGRTVTGVGELPEETHTSPHNVQLEEGRAYIAHYKLGVWVIDVSTPQNQTDPPVVAYYMDDGMNVWDVVLNEGVVYASGSSGLRALESPLSPIGGDGIVSRT